MPEGLYEYSCDTLWAVHLHHVCMNARVSKIYIVYCMATRLFVLMDSMQAHNIRSLQRLMLQCVTLVIQ
jgi:hypothetical protein